LEHEAEGGVGGRHARYQKNCQVLVGGMRALGFRTYLPDHLQAPIIITFYSPPHERFLFDQFYDALKIRGFAIYPGKLMEIDTFRIGCIGRLDEGDMTAVVNSVREVIAEMGVTP
jgi:2-aminoethylphosphonate-pyruvate transaminase